MVSVRFVPPSVASVRFVSPRKYEGFDGYSDPGLVEWLWPKFQWQLIAAGMIGAVLLLAWLFVGTKSTPAGEHLKGRYATLPEVCYCPQCGYEIGNPGMHCPQLGPCPKCGSPRLWRKK